jgi:hypothetical protein
MVRAISREPSIRQVPAARSRWISIPTAPFRRVASSAAVRSPVLVAAAGVALIAGLTWPLVFTGPYFTGDWLGQLWFMWHQALALRTNHAPSLYLNYVYGVFYPQYAFYGGTLYVLTGSLSLLLGSNPVEAYVLTYLLGFAASYGGWYWLARGCGLGRWWAQAPGLVFITSPYYQTLIYARGDWPEFIAVAMIPLILGSGLSVLRAERLRLWPGLALVVGVVFLTGSHSLTLVWGTSMIALVAFAILLCVPRARRGVTRAGVLRVAGLVVPAGLLSAWFLVPAAAYESSTLIATEYVHWQLLLRATMNLVSAGNLFTISRASDTTSGAFALSLPILVMGWALVSLAIVARHGLRGTWVRIALICGVLTAGLTVLMTHAGLILALPRAWATMQFSYRLESYVLLALSGTVLALLVLATRGRRPPVWGWAVLPVLAVAVVGGLQQAKAHPTGPDRYTSFHHLYGSSKPGTGEVLIDYVDVHLPLLHDPYGHPPYVRFPAAAIRDNHISRVVHLAPGQLFYTNIQAPPSLLHINGARIAGVTTEGYDVLEMSRDPTPAPGGGAIVALSPAEPLPVVAGRVLSFCALAALLLQFGALAARRRGWRLPPRRDGRA